MRKLQVGGSALVVLALVAGALVWAGHHSGRAVDIRARSARVTAATNDLGFGLLHKLYGAGEARNVVVSPVSAALALHMAYNGARGTTRDDMAKALRIDGIATDEVNRNDSELIAEMPAADPKVEITIADSLWSSPKAATDAATVQRLKEAYDAEIRYLSGGAAPINAWVNDRTDGKIPTIIQDDDLMKMTAAVLVDAVYFKGRWTTEFDPQRTRDGSFTHLDGSIRDCKMMSVSSIFNLASDSDVSAVQMPYGNGRLEMLILLPVRNAGFAKFVAGLSRASVDRLLRRMQATRCAIHMPRLRLTGSEDLVKPLADLGMARAFDADADFSGLFPAGDVWIGHARQRTLLDCDEQGTEAAVATGMTLEYKGGPMEYAVWIDHPFVFLLRDTQTGAILFLGAVVDPG